MLKVKSNTLLLLFLLFGAASFAQKGSQSPYSSYGLGELNYEGYASFSSMGGIALGMTDSTIVNTANPASYSFIGRHRPILQLGLNGRLSSFSTATASANQGHFGLNQFQLGLPIKKNWGAVIGIRPYSFTGYEISKYTVDADSDTTMLTVNEGSGGIRIATFGLSYRPFNFSKPGEIEVSFKAYDKDSSKVKEMRVIKGKKYNSLSLGINANYLFGTSKQIRSSEFLPLTTTTFNSRVEDGLRVSGLSLEAGINYQVGFRSIDIERALSIGVTYSPATEVRAFQDLFAYSYIGSFYRGVSIQVRDTIEHVLDNEGVILKPESYKGGFEYRFSPYGRNSLLRIGADVSFERWSTFYTQFSNVRNPGGLKDRLSVGAGLEWTPMLIPDGVTGPFGKMKYRLGFNYTQTELLVENSLETETEIDNYGMSFGVGIPVRVNNSNTNINFGANLGNLGTTENGLIQERYVGLYFGISVTPGRGNYWFVKRKYD